MCIVYTYITYYFYTYIDIFIYVCYMYNGCIEDFNLKVFPPLKLISCSYSSFCVLKFFVWNFMRVSHWVHDFYQQPLGNSSSLRCNVLDFHNPMASWREDAQISQDITSSWWWLGIPGMSIRTNSFILPKLMKKLYPSPAFWQRPFQNEIFFTYTSICFSLRWWEAHFKQIQPSTIGISTEQCSKPWLFSVYRGLYHPVI